MTLAATAQAGLAKWLAMVASGDFRGLPSIVATDAVYRSPVAWHHRPVGGGAAMPTFSSPPTPVLLPAASAPRPAYPIRARVAARRLQFLGRPVPTES